MSGGAPGSRAWPGLRAAVGVLVVLLVAGATRATGAAAQAAAVGTVRPGARIRVTIDARAPVTGSLAYFRSDTLGLRLAGPGLVRAVPLDSVTFLETSEGQRSHLVPYTMIGIASGVALGLVVAVASETSWAVGRAAVRGGLIGGGLGLVAGLGSSQEKWRPAPVGALRAGVDPTGPSPRVPAGGVTLVWRVPL